MSYTPTRDDIKNLGAYDAEKLLQGVLWSYADRIGAGKKVVGRIVESTVSRRPAEHVKDGGLELTVSLPDSVVLQPPFEKHNMIVQVKSGEPLTKTAIWKELDKARVKEFLKAGGHYVIAYTGFVPTYGEHEKTWRKEQLESLRGAIEKALGKTTTVTGEVWHVDEIERLVKTAPQAWDVFPTANLFKALSSQTLQSLIDSNSFAKSGFDIPFALGGDRENTLLDLTTWLSSFNGYYEIRGNMGIGKSRLVYEAIRKVDREATTVWLPFRPSDPTFIANCQAFLHGNPSATLRVVADECDDDIADQLRNLASMFATRVCLLSIFPFRSRDATKNPGSDVRLLGKMSRADLKTLLGTFQLRQEVEDWIAQICDGYPKLARVLAESAKKETDSLTREKLIAWLSDHEVFRDETRKDKGWVNLILTSEDQEVLGALSLLTEVGYQGHRQNESRHICDFFQIKEDMAERSIRKNLDKGLLTQGSDYVYVTPLILASYLCAYKIGGMRAEKITQFSSLIQGFPRPQFGKSALEAFTERIKMSSLEEGAQTKLQSVLDHIGPFDKAVLQSEVVAELAFACCHFQPHLFLASFVRELRTRPVEEVKAWTEGRRCVVRFLEAAAFYPELFDEAADALYLLANAENETWSNNATGIWSDYFSPGLSGSMAPLPQRAAWLIRLIEFGNGNPVLIQSALESLLKQAQSRMAGHENQLGLPYIEVKHGFLIGEYHRALSDVISVIQRNVQRLADLKRILIDSLRSLTRYGFIQGHLDVVTWLKEQSENDLALQQRLLVACEQILKWESKLLPAEAKTFFEHLRYHLEFDSFQNTVRRWSFDPLLDDYKLEKEKNNPLQLLILDIIGNPEKVSILESILTHPKASRSWFIMYKLGELDTAQVLWPYFDRWSKGDARDALISRYLVGRFYAKANPDWIDDQLDELNNRSIAKNFIVDSSKDVETKRSFFRLLNLAKSNSEYIRLFVFGGRASRLSADELTHLVDFFRISESPIDLSPMWDVLGQYVHDHKQALPLPEAQIKFLLSSLYAPTVGTMTEHYQNEALKILLDFHIDKARAEALARSCLGVIVDAASDYDHSRRCGELLRSLAHKWPDEVFDAVFEKMEADKGAGLFRLENILDDWAHGLFNDRLERKVESCDEIAGELVARLMPDSYGALNNTSAILLKRFPSNDAIGSAIARSFLSGAFSGSITDRLVAQIQALDSWAAQKNLKNMAMIINLRDSLSRELETTKKVEEEAEFLRQRDR